MSTVRIEHITKTFGSNVVLKEFHDVFNDGEFVTLLGPSGCGKTTMLRIIAGFERPTDGSLYIDDQLVSGAKAFIPPEKRSVGMVFQSYAVWPHMNVFDNVAYPLTIKHTPKAEIAEKVKRVLEIVHLGKYADRFPNQLSGGQQQRVALARALVYNPPILLMDEPLGALDRQLRQRMQFEIKHIQKNLGITVVYVTHDQEEALTMSDEVVVMNRGRIEQKGTPWELYESPANRFVAEFMGESNLLSAEVVEAYAGGGRARIGTGDVVDFRTDHPLKSADPIVISVRPEKISLAPDPRTHNVLPGRIRDAAYLGEASRFIIGLSESEHLIVKQPNLSFAQIGTQIGASMPVGWAAEDGVVLVK